MDRTVRQIEILSDIRTLFHKQEEHMKGNDERFLRETGVSSMSLSELHVIQCIGKKGLMNVTAITEEMGMTKGAISKICTKLFNKQFVEKMRMLDNQKEIFFRLTDNGNEIYMAHEKLHQQAEEKWLLLLNQYTEEELSLIQRFVKDVGAHLEK
ncbi:MarR family transcriptional regulator [Bacillus pseudomycoides]|uniref:MarR family transcriptional regulator n=1 Tax=Bacillus pseudomycoides TaxID=64104 RepID=A0A2B6JQF2_9BACI|nr:MarR family transcriptional regulator [Bacillus pseudomycoides]PDY46333.1 MarR family transcriptional regulator [Bacillus pseudomycoides]PEA84794.1 MarR family transcriptional regulator [Bacillus pseudomycoides]PED72215.1 MarR family transcriptional regulator [Bacillus pseudomycoides]PEI40777.1 MarR family transcriptional regulator [Bacillus pseudomycoides]PEJ79010.1 MarR family transcriptional regulator [Bacillus pseudomycoides]